MTKQEVVDYYKAWGGNALQFTDMLMRKATFALRTNKKVMAHGKMRTGKQLEQMFIIADDLACEGLLS